MPFGVLLEVLCFQCGSVMRSLEPAPLRPTGGESTAPIPPNQLIPGQIETLHTPLRHATVGHGLPPDITLTCCSKGTMGTRVFSPPNSIKFCTRKRKNQMTIALTISFVLAIFALLRWGRQLRRSTRIGGNSK